VAGKTSNTQLAGGARNIQEVGGTRNSQADKNTIMFL
jgi:hypothetical protein